MSELVKSDEWVWIIVQDPEGNEQFLGQYDSERCESFIPAFLKKEEAQEGLKHLSCQSGYKYEIQAIRFDDLLKRVKANEFMLFILDGPGNILEKITP